MISLLFYLLGWDDAAAVGQPMLKILQLVW
jgi:hypothetical protein